MNCIFESLYISISFMTIICKENDIDGKARVANTTGKNEYAAPTIIRGPEQCSKHGKMYREDT